jgi:cell wall-associated NlpC family hydrolase
VLGSSVSQAVGDRAGSLGRSGAVLAVTSGLVASFGVGAEAAPTGLDLTSTGSALGLQPVDGAGVPVRGALLASGALTAPAAAAVSFDDGALKAQGTAASRAAARTARAEARAAALRSALAVATPPATAAAATTTATASTAAAAAKAKAAAAAKAKAAAAAKAKAAAAAKAKAAAAAKAKAAAAAKAGSTTKATAPVVVPQGARASAIISIAMRYRGIAYVYGGTTPRGFDCSGFVQYVFKQVGLSLPRTADAQMRATRSIKAADARAGDLVFFVSSSGQATHVGIVTAKGMMIDSPRTGKSISVRAIYSSKVVYRRVTG